MHINNFDNNLNFNGTFRFSTLSRPERKKIFPNILQQKGFKVIQNVVEEGDTVIMAKNSIGHDSLVLNCIKNYKGEVPEFDYYPSVYLGNLKFTKENLAELLKSEKNKRYQDVDKITHIIEAKPKVKSNCRKEIEKLYISLGLNLQEPKIKANSQSLKIEDRSRKRIIELIDDQNSGLKYVYIYPESRLSGDSERYILDKDWKIKEKVNTIDQMLEFSKQFKILKLEKQNCLY